MMHKQRYDAQIQFFISTLHYTRTEMSPSLSTVFDVEALLELARAALIVEQGATENPDSLE